MNWGGGISTFDRLCLNGSFVIGRFAVPMFFIMSGYFTFPIKGNTFSFLNKRFERIIPPFMIWVIIYELVLSTPSNYLHDIIHLTKAPQMWYLYALIGITILLPILSPYFSHASRKEYHLYLGIWAVTLVFNGNYFEVFRVIETDHQGLLFNNPISCISHFYGYTGYIILGAYFRRYGFSVRCTGIASLIAILFFLMALNVLHVDDANALGYCTIVNCLLSMSVISIVKNIVSRMRFSEKEYNIIVTIGKLTFGVYLIHWLLFQLVYTVNYFKTANCILTTIVVFILSILSTLLLTKLPKSKYIIG